MTDPVNDAAVAARAGRLIVLPTDTVYGIGSRPDLPEATDRIFAAKRRPRDLDLPVLVPSGGAAREIAVLDDRATRLAERFWPGALTLVLRRTDASRSWNLGRGGSTIAVRVPRHPLALAVLERTGPLAITSANRSGGPPLATCEDLEATFGDAVDVYLCGPEPLVGVASTVLDLATGEPTVLRAGAVGGDDVRAVLEA